MKPNAAQIQMLELGLITTDKYQRDIIQPHLNGLVVAFDPELVGVLMVSPRKAGGYYVWDGNHRLEALKKKGYTHWHCMVTDKSPIESAIAFEETNDRVRRVSPIQKHEARLFRDDPKALELEEALMDADCHVGKAGLGHVGAVTACYTVLEKYGAEVLTKTLRVLNWAWGIEDKSARSAALIGGISRLVFEVPTLSVAQIAAPLGEKKPTGGSFTGAAQGAFAASGGSKGKNQYTMAWNVLHQTKKYDKELQGS